METVNDKLSIKNLLFSKAIPNYEIPIPVNGVKLFPCTDCGDKFLFESSYQDHHQRKSVLITYMCRYCSQTKIFYNRCNLLCHIRSHAFKTATINVQDLKVEPIPISLLNVQKSLTKYSSEANKQPVTSENSSKNVNVCFECKEKISQTGLIYKARAAHFMQYTNEIYTCPLCLFTLPTLCALRAHIRFHIKCPPYVCPECGCNIPAKNIYYPFNHDCEGFKMMRATARLKCSIDSCQLLHPNDFKDHMKEKHIKKVYKCPVCVVACFNESTMRKHLQNHIGENKALIFYQCELCPGRLVLMCLMDNHLRTHENANVFPCWTCAMLFNETNALIQHHIASHALPRAIKQLLLSLLNEEKNIFKPKRIYRVVKRCDQCKRNFTYKCKYDEIRVLPSECPYKCSSNLTLNVTPDEPDEQITCHFCKVKMSSDWDEIKKHYALLHKNYRCLEPKISLERVDILKYTKQKTRPTPQKSRARNKKSNENDIELPEKTSSIVKCKMCDDTFNSKDILENHLVSHRDPCMAYQCMECGQCFVVKPSFSKHLLLEHAISEVDKYISDKKCYNESALEKCQNIDPQNNEPLKENQCTICRDQFDNSEDLEKHFRVHGMAFLLKNTSNKS